MLNIKGKIIHGLIYTVQTVTSNGGFRMKMTKSNLIFEIETMLRETPKLNLLLPNKSWKQLPKQEMGELYRMIHNHQIDMED